MTLKEFRDTLQLASADVYHLEAAPDSQQRYIVWKETGVGNYYGSNAADGRYDKIRILVYTKTEYDNLIYELLDILDDADVIAYRDPVIEWDPDKKMLEYTIDCEVS